MTDTLPEVPKFLVKPHYVVETSVERINGYASPDELLRVFDMYLCIISRWSSFVSFVDMIEIKFAKKTEDSALVMTVETTLGDQHMPTMGNRKFVMGNRKFLTEIAFPPVPTGTAAEMADLWAAGVRRELGDQRHIMGDMLKSLSELLLKPEGAGTRS